MEHETRYASSGGVNIAYQTHGEGPLDLIFVPGFISHVEHLWEEPGLARFLDRLSSFARLILYDRRGTGLSDRLGQAPTQDEELADLEAVLDAVGSERAALMAYTVGGQLASIFAATRPERTSALLMYATIVRATFAEDYSWAHSPEEREERMAQMAANWGQGSLLEVMAPSAADDARLKAWLGRMERLSLSPGALRQMTDAIGQTDVRDSLEHIRVPTLILHRADDQMIDPGHSRYLAEAIPGAKYVEMPGRDNYPGIDPDSIADEVEEFLTGGRRVAEPQRALLTVMFTDIVDSTVRASELGDQRWRDLLSSHDSIVRKELQRFDGHEVKTIGDGFLAVFDGAPTRAVRCAHAISKATEEIGVDVRAGLHTGECELMGEDVGGMAVHIGARISALATGGEVLASNTLREAVLGSPLAFEDRGTHSLKGVPGEWRVYAAADGRT
jgi:class 3 adenylate cyclase/alpha-beta hydrolase superfamily lysophospholipase